MSERLFENDIREYAKVVNVPKAVAELVNDINTHVVHEPFVNKGLLSMSNYGCVIGSFIDSYIPDYLTKYSKLTFKKGNDTKNEDCVCETNAFYNTEVKTTCTKAQQIVGAKTNAGKGYSNLATKYKTDNYHFYIFVAFKKPQTANDDLKIANIWIGMLKPSDWSISNSNRNGRAWINKPIFNKQFINVKDLY